MGKAQEIFSTEAKIEILADTINMYCQHEHWCPATDYDECTCGLDDRLKALKFVYGLPIDVREEEEE